MNKKFISLLGFARRSGNVIMGFDFIERKVGKVKLVVSATDVSDRTEKNIRALGLTHIKTDLTKDELGHLLGSGNVAAVGITDGNFATQLEKYAETERE